MQTARHLPPRKHEPGSRPVDHTDSVALRILADHIAAQARTQHQHRDFVVLG